MLEVLSGKKLSTTSYKELVKYFVAMVDQMPQSKVEFNNTLANGLFIREMKVQKGTLVVSAEHISNSVLILSEGSMRILSDKGIRDYKSHAMIIAPPGTQRIGYATSDAVATCVYRTDAKTVEEALAECVMGGADILIGGVKNKQYETNRRLIDAANHAISM